MNISELQASSSEPAGTRPGARTAPPGPGVSGGEELSALLGELCLAFLDSGEHDRAREAWAGLAAIEPEAPATRQLAGLLAFADGRFAAAEASYRRVLEVDPRSRSTRVFLAESLIAQKRWREAYDLLDALTGESADDPSVRFAKTLRQGLASGLFQHGG